MIRPTVCRVNPLRLDLGRFDGKPKKPTRITANLIAGSDSPSLVNDPLRSQPRDQVPSWQSRHAFVTLHPLSVVTNGHRILYLLWRQ